jgi:hypothetical protein
MIGGIILADVQILLRISGILAFLATICAIASWVGVQFALAGIADVEGTATALGALYLICIFIAVFIWAVEFEG